MEFKIEDGAPPQIRRKGGRQHGPAARAVLALRPGQKVNLKGVPRGSALRLAWSAGQQTGGKFTGRTEDDRTVTIYRTAYRTAPARLVFQARRAGASTTTAPRGRRMAVEIIEGDCVESLGRLPAASHQCCVTSPPYYGLRDYGHAGQIGLEPTPEEYIARMVEVFREVRRVLRDDGTLWLNIGDSYAAGKCGRTDQDRNTRNRDGRNTENTTDTGAPMYGQRKVPDGLKAKDLIGIPWQLAFALRADGWFLRSAIVWHKPNPMPESVRDRPTSAYEHVFLLTKRAAYFYDADAIREEHARLWDETNGGNMSPDGRHKAHDGYRERGGAYPLPNPLGRNARNVWTIATQPYSGAHFATMPPDLAERCIKAGTSEKGQCPHCGSPWVRVVDVESRPNAPPCNGKYDGKGKHRTVSGGVSNDARAKVDRGWHPSCDCPAHAAVPQHVLDPFGGAGTTGLVADRLGRHATLCEINPEYARLARARIHDDAPLLGSVA